MFQMIGRFLKISVLSFIVVTLLAACRTREIAYVSDATRDSAQQILSVYDNTILPGDQLYIHVAKSGKPHAADAQQQCGEGGERAKYRICQC